MKFLLRVVAVATAATALKSLPDLARYFEMREM